jgi:hypoxanthine-DNA glycosylase
MIDLMRKYLSNETKASFAPICDMATEILILGSLPGEKSLTECEYYAHPQNRFWRIIAAITYSANPVSYSDKMSLLIDHKIGVWDVVLEAKRIGSLDSNIIDVVPNDFECFFPKQKSLKTVGFNGTKAANLFDKYFIRPKHLKFVRLPSSSPANAKPTFDEICKKWQELLN